MNIAIIANSDEFIPLAYTLANQGRQLTIFLSPPQDPYILAKVSAWLQSTNIPFVTETDHHTDVYRWLEQNKPDVLFVFGYKYLLDVNKISIPAFNIHGGPLPSFR